MLAEPRRRFERRFYLGSTVVFLGLVVWTFARTYFLRPFFAARPLGLLLHVHGVVMSGWVALLVVQSALVAVRRVRWHRRLGVFGAGWAGMVVILGTVTTIHAAAREVQGHTARAAPQVIILGFELVQMLLFASFAGAAIGLRRKVDFHKRLMLLTIPCMLPSVLARLPVEFMTNDVILVSLHAMVIGCIGIDTWRQRRLHPAFGWGGLTFLVAIDAAFAAAQTPRWIAFATKLLS